MESNIISNIEKLDEIELAVCVSGLQNVNCGQSIKEIVVNKYGFRT